MCTIESNAITIKTEITPTSQRVSWDSWPSVPSQPWDLATIALLSVPTTAFSRMSYTCNQTVYTVLCRGLLWAFSSIDSKLWAPCTRISLSSAWKAGRGFVWVLAPPPSPVPEPWPGHRPQQEARVTARLALVFLSGIAQSSCLMPKTSCFMGVWVLVVNSRSRIQFP